MGASDAAARRAPAHRKDRPPTDRRRLGPPAPRRKAEPSRRLAEPRPMRRGRTAAARSPFPVPFDDALDPAFDEVGDIDGHLDGLAARLRAVRSWSEGPDDQDA